MSFPRYPEYKDSGARWLGAVPEHWAVSPLKYLVTFRSGGTPSKANEMFWDGDVPWVSAKDMKSEILENSEDHVSNLAVEAGEAQLLPPEAVLVVVRGMILARTFPVAVTTRAVTFNQDLKALLPCSALSSRFLANYLRGTADESLTRLDEAGHGTKALRMDAWSCLHVALPPLLEQRAISTFLDIEINKIDALVAEQERLIVLLKEKRQAVISHAVTKGLNPDAPTKPSGIEWLGDVPAHWTVTPLKWLTDPMRPIMYGIVLPGPDVGEGVPILKGGNVKPSRMNLESMARTTPEIEAPYARARLKAGDLVYSIRGSIGDCEDVPESLEGSNITQDVARIAVADGYCSRWVRWALLSSAVREELASGSLGAAIRGVNIFDLKRANLPTPLLPEQIDVADFLDEATAQCDELIGEANRAINLFKERRSALISAAVTGQIDVRGLASTPGSADAAPRTA